METVLEALIRLLDELDDFIATLRFRLQRALARTPRERRQRPRLNPAAAGTTPLLQPAAEPAT